MALNRCLFAVQLRADGESRRLLDERIERLRAFFEPLGVRSLEWSWNERLRLATGSLEVDTIGGLGVAPAVEVGIWGATPPPELQTAGALLDADDAGLRALDVACVVVACGKDRARLVAGAGPPVSLMAAEGPECSVWATHAVAAAWLATGRVRVDTTAVPELLAFGTLLADRSVIEGVRVLPLATCVDISAAGAATRVYWSAPERWATVPEADAAVHAEQALLDVLARHLRAEPGPYLALTAGRDSPLLAAAARKLDVDLRTFTWGEDTTPDVVGARSVAAAFGLPHVHLPLTRTDEAAAWAQIFDDTCWSDAAAGIGGYGIPSLPADLTLMISGAGAEVGRAYYYHWTARSRPRPRLRDLMAALAAGTRVPDASPEARATVEERLAAALERARELGHRGWTALDVFYVEERMTRWGRARMPRTAAALIAPFCAPEVARALVSLPFETRMNLDFHRAFVASVAPALRLPDQRTQRRGVPAIARRLMSSVRRSGPRPFERWPFADVWLDKPAVKQRIADELLGDPLLAEALGTRWRDRLRDGFLADDARYAEAALLAAAPVVLQRAADQRLNGLR